MSLAGSIGPPTPEDANIDYGLWGPGVYLKFHYQVGKKHYVCIYMPQIASACSNIRSVYFSILSNTIRVYESQYTKMNQVNNLISNFNLFILDLNKCSPHMVKYMGKITTTLYDTFIYQMGSQLNILTNKHIYQSINTLDIIELLSFDINNAYDQTHHIVQELIKRQIAACPESIPCIDTTNFKNINKKYTPIRFNASQYIAYRRRKIYEIK
jgi:hypothetical protein